MGKKPNSPEEAIAQFLIIRLDGEGPRLLGIYKTKQEKEDRNRLPHWLNEALPENEWDSFGIQTLRRARAVTPERPCLDWVIMEVDNFNTFIKELPGAKILTLDELFKMAKKERGENGLIILEFQKRKPAIAALEVLQVAQFSPAAPNFHRERKKHESHRIEVSFDDVKLSPFADLVPKIDWKHLPQNLLALRRAASLSETPLPVEKLCFATCPRDSHRDLAVMMRWLRLLTDIDIQLAWDQISYPRGNSADLRKIFPSAKIPTPPSLQQRLL